MEMKSGDGLFPTGFGGEPSSGKAQPPVLSVSSSTGTEVQCSRPYPGYGQ